MNTFEGECMLDICGMTSHSLGHILVGMEHTWVRLSI